VDPFDGIFVVLGLGLVALAIFIFFPRLNPLVSCSVCLLMLIFFGYFCFEIICSAPPD